MSSKRSPILRKKNRSPSCTAECFSNTTASLLSSFLAQKEFTKAIEQCDRALAVGSTDAGILNFRARANYLLANYDRAIEDLTSAIKLDSKQAMFHSNRGFSFMGLRQYEKALADFELAIKLDPALANPQRGRDLARTQLEIARDGENRGQERWAAAGTVPPGDCA